MFNTFVAVWLVSTSWGGLHPWRSLAGALLTSCMGDLPFQCGNTLKMLLH